MRMQRFCALATAAILALWVSANLVGAEFLVNTRADFSADQAFSLRPETDRTLKNLGEPVRLSLFLSKAAAADRPDITGYAARVEELLKTFAARAGGGVEVATLDAPAGSQAALAAEAAGVTPIESADHPPIVFGLAGANGVDTLGAIARLDWRREASLESEIALLVNRLDDPAPKKIALISSLPAASVEGKRARELWAGPVFDQMRRSYAVDALDESFDSIPATTDALVILHPFPLSERQLYVIEQFILARGKALIALDPLALGQLSASGRRLYPGAQGASSLGPLLARWGVDYGAAAFTAAPDGRSFSPIALGPDHAVLVAPGAFTTRALAQVRPKILLEGPAGLTRAAPETFFAPPAPPRPAARPQTDDASRPPPPIEAPPIFGLRLAGVLQTAYPNGSPPRPRVDAGDPDVKQLVRSSAPADVILLADSDFLGGAPDAPASAPRPEIAFTLGLIDSLFDARRLSPPRQGAPTFRPMNRRTQWLAGRPGPAGADAPEPALRARLVARADDAEAALAARVAAEPANGGTLAGDFAANRTPEEKAEHIRLRERALAAQAALAAFDARAQRAEAAEDRFWTLVTTFLPAVGLMLIGAVLALRRHSLKTLALRSLGKRRSEGSS